MQRRIKSKLITVWVTPKEHAILIGQAKKEDRTLSDLIRRSLWDRIHCDNNVKEQGAGNGRTDSCQMQ